MARGVNTKANGIDFRANRFDEFLKLIPQNLTDAEKAQVMANLGITPTPGSLDGAVRYDAAQTLTDEQKQQAQENAGVAEALAEKANIDGYYSQLTAGAAENLVGGNETTREFTEDTAGGTADIADGKVQIEKVKGNTIVWNQQANYNNIGYVSARGTVEVVGNKVIATPNEGIHDLYISFNNPKITYNHIYYLKTLVFIQNTHSISAYAGVNSKPLFAFPNVEGNKVNLLSQIKNFSYNTTFNGISFNIYDNDKEFYIENCQLIDLTLMFGEGNEPATVAEFEKLFPLDYYDYNAGQLLSLNPTGIKTVGFNAYNHATGKASVIGGKQYQITGAYTSITEGDTTITPDSDGLFTPTHNGDLTIAGGNSTTTCVHLVWSGVRNGDFEEHWEETRNIPIANINTDGTITESADGKTRLFTDGLCSVGGSFDEVSQKRAIKRIGARAYEEGDKEDTSVLTDGTTTLYVLATPIEVTFAEPINLTYRVSDFGTETLLPINTETPVTTPIRLDVVYGLNVVDFVRNADKNYLTIEDSTGDNGSSFTNLRNALSTAFGIDIIPTYDSTNKRYTFAISDNRKVEVPESATSNGAKGTWAEDATSVYFCTDTNTWVKINKETW